MAIEPPWTCVLTPTRVAGGVRLRGIGPSAMLV